MITEAKKLIDSFCDQLLAIPDDKLAAVFKEYIHTQRHDTNWEGFLSRDVTGVRRFLEDVLAYYYAQESK